jgi:hypothetical protein
MPHTNSDFHWSKDFVEHLRSVHFALMTVCASLLVLMLHAKNYDPRMALTEAEEILKFKQTWSVEWALKTLEWKPVQLHTCEYAGPASDGVVPIETPGGQLVAGVLETIPSATRKHQDFMLLLPKPSWFQPASFSRKSGLLVSVESLPTTKLGFAAWWDGLDTFKPTIYVPGDMCTEAVVTDATGNQHTNQYALVRSEITKESQSTRTLKADVTMINSGGSNKFGYSVDLGSSQIAFFPFASIQGLTLTREELAAHFKSWGTGSFIDAFYDFDQASKDIAYWDLEDIGRRLAEDAAKVDVFEVWGVRIPAGQLTIGGICVVLGIQFYLMLYLKSLRGKLRPQDAGWDVPWLAMDLSLLARCAYFLSVTALPVFAIWLLVQRGWYAHPAHQPVSAEPATSLSIRFVGVAEWIERYAAPFISLLLGAAAWCYRPRPESITAGP